MKCLRSKTDNSVNWINPFKNSVIETRYVRRGEHYISAYLSSQNGCNMGCKFCWLTVTKQDSFKHVDIPAFSMQLGHVLDHAKEIDSDVKKRKKVRVNINMMSRGEPLANRYIVNRYREFYEALEDMVVDSGYKEMKMNISTIMPHTMKQRELTDVLCTSRNDNTNIYYSLYSIKEQFRKKWIPNALPYKKALRKLKNYQDKSGKPIAIHFALIEGENDNVEDVQDMCDILREYNFERLKFNLVRFNPHPSMSQYKEPTQEKMDRIFDMLKKVAKDETIVTNKSRTVPRAGPDVFASCGMFINPHD